MTLALGLLAAYLLVYLLHRLIRDRRHSRRLGPVEDLPRFPAYGAELGQPLHLSLGTGGVGGAEGGGMATLASLALAEGLAGRSWRSGAPLLISAATGTALALAQTLAARLSRGSGGAEDGLQVRLLGLGGVPYAAAALGRSAREEEALALYAGQFGPEYLLLGESAARQGTALYAGGVQPEILPYQLLTTPHTLMGEELFAAGAFGRGRDGRARLAAADWLRWAVILLILALAAAGL